MHLGSLLSVSALTQKLMRLLPLSFRRHKVSDQRAVPREDAPEIHRAIELRGRYNYGLEYIKIYDWNKEDRVVIGSFNSISLVECLLGGNHRTDWLTTYPFGHMYRKKFPNGRVHGLEGQPTSKGNIVIKNDAWIGFGSTVLSGVTIGNGSVLAARCVVTKDVPDYAVVGGNPARILKYRFEQRMIDLLLEIAWWDEDDAIIDAIVPTLQSIATFEDVLNLRDQIGRLKRSKPGSTLLK